MGKNEQVEGCGSENSLNTIKKLLLQNYKDHVFKGP